MKHILLLEEVADEVLANPEREACFFGTDNFLFPEKGTGRRATGPYTFLFYALPRIPECLDEEFYAVPYIPGDPTEEDETFHRVRELRQKFPFTEFFAFLGKGEYTRTHKGQELGKPGIPLEFIKFQGVRPVVNKPPKYTLDSIKTANLRKAVPNPGELLDYLADKIKQIKLKYS